MDENGQCLDLVAQIFIDDHRCWSHHNVLVCLKTCTWLCGTGSSKRPQGIQVIWFSEGDETG